MFRVFLVALTLAAFSSAQVRAQDVARPTIELQVTGAEPGDTWFAQHGSSEPVRLCEAPCKLKIKADTLRFGVAKANREFPDFDAQKLTLRESSSLQAEHVSRRGKRIGGGVLVVTSLLFGSLGLLGGLMSKSWEACETGESCKGEAKLGAGAWAWVGINVATLIGGFVLMFKSDEVHVTATPLQSPEPEARPEPAVNEPASS